ncbi:SDR family NAD(P)-dependent oxidoreductase [Bacillus mangrovi]|uniref:SDR family NAD(P)-dependent oxidoreductase n=1 Tax=Metabacillus mangrovi TaxID=1491830 RepID=A0A7X2S3V2_9BACI|nr:SDR family oxidoreductase [Metabacillus mangrovi]MTH52296.1 SDR family NAD(P)-dependent oxidoreductase [Metabacillus mangrovi]
MKLKNKVVYITGASGGIGEAMARKTAAAGASVVLLARREEKLKTLAAELRDTYGTEALYSVLDVSDTGAIEPVFRELLAKTGRIDVLINNAGFGVFKTVEDSALKEMEKMFKVNVFGLIGCTKAVLPAMRAQGSGHVINIASQAGKIATPKSSLYSATKHAVLGFSNSLRMECKGTGIQVTTVNPGPIRTDFFDTADESGEYTKNVERWMLTPEFVAEKVVQSIVHYKREINLPRWMNAGSTVYQLAPGLIEKLAGNAFNKK